MKGFTLNTKDGRQIRFAYDTEHAPHSSRAFQGILPFTRIFYHARVSGQEIWIDNMPPLDTIQENASVFTLPGEAVLGPVKPARTRTANCFGIYYGEGKGLDAANIFAKVLDEDLPALQQLGDEIWRSGAVELRLAATDEEGE
jgi:hypothetical protein